MHIDRLTVTNSDLNFIEFDNLEVINIEASSNTGFDDYLDELIRL